MKKKAYLFALIVLLAVLPLVFMISGIDPAIVMKNSRPGTSSPSPSETIAVNTPGNTNPSATDTDSPTPWTLPPSTAPPYTPQFSDTPNNTGGTSPTPTPNLTAAPSPTVRTDGSGMNHISDDPTQYPDDTATKTVPTHSVSAGSPTISPFVIKTSYINTDIPVAHISVMQFGAKGDGVTDDTKAFEDAIEFCANRTDASIIYVPAGMYLLSRPITINGGITLRGDWPYPGIDNPGIGSVLLINTGRNNESGAPAVTVDGSAMINISLFYPEQDIFSPVPYSPCICLRGMSRIENITLVNPYVGIAINGPESEAYLKNIYMTPLSCGILADDSSADIVAENIIINPEYWASFDPGIAPGGYKALTSEQKYALEEFLLNTVCGICLDDYSVFRFYGGLISRINTAILLDCAGASSGAAANVRINECKYGVLCRENTPSGFQITDCIFNKATACIDMRPGASGVLKLNMCEFYYSGSGIIANGLADSVLSISNCVFFGTTDAIRAISGSFSVMQCNFLPTGLKVHFADTVSPSVYIGNTGGSITYGPNVLFIAENPGFTQYSRFRHVYKNTLPRQYTNHLYNVSDFGAVPSEAGAAGWTDCTAAFRAALEAAAETGGTVFIPEGIYHLSGTLTVPEGVELRGICSAQTVNAGQKCWLFVRGGAGSVHTSTPFITLGKNSGIRGFNIYYPDQNKVHLGQAPVSYEWTVQGKASGVYCIGVSAFNGSNFCDFGSVYECAGYYFANSGGAVFEKGFFGGGNPSNGWVENARFDIHMLLSIDPSFPGSGYTANPAVANQYLDNLLFRTTGTSGLQAFVFGHNASLQALNLTARGAREGIRFISQAGRVTNGKVIGYHCENCGYGISVYATDKVEVINMSFISRPVTGEPAIMHTAGSSTGETVLIGCNAIGTGLGACLDIRGGAVCAQQLSNYGAAGCFITNSGGITRLEGCIESRASANASELTSGKIYAYANSRTGDAFSVPGAEEIGNFGY